MIDRQTVEHVAKLARVDLTDKEIEKFSEEFSDILDLFSSLKDVDTDGVEPSFHPIELKNSVREDEPEKCLTQEEALANAEQKEDGFFKGPRSV
jgi:aspartyl-tRNA(Asn)/glutamyl-tRNA(Gln) amidotransferase subunit C